MLIKYDKPNVLTVAIPVNKQVCSTVRFMPGVNDISAKEWDQIKDLEKIKKLIKSKMLTVLDASVTKKGEPPMTGILGLAAGEAVKVVKDTFDLETLERWKSEDSRKHVLKFLEIQIKAVNSQAAGDDG